MNSKSAFFKCKNKNRFVICFLFTILYIQMLNNSTIYAKSFYGNVTDYEMVTDPFIDLQITAPSAVVIDADSGIVVFDKNKDEKNFPASITKIMTALLTLEKYEDDLDARISFSHDAVFSLPYGSSHIAMNDGETLSVEDAMNGLMLASANDVANALAENIGGTMEKFAEMMTARAKSLSAENTNFTNAHGLHDENHYTTAYDMALIMKEAIKHEDFVRYISTRRYDIPPTEKQINPRQLVNSNKMIQTGQFAYEYAVGGKTGFTNESMHTLVTYAKKDNVSLIAVVMHDEKSAAYTDTIDMLNIAFNNYKSLSLSELRIISGSVPVVQYYDGSEYEAGTVDYETDKSLTVMLPSFITSESIVIEKNIPDKLTAPIRRGDSIGTVEYKFNGSLLGQIELNAKNDVDLVQLTELAPEPTEDIERSAIEDILKYLRFILIFSCVFFVLIIILLILLIRRRNIRRRRRRNARVNSYRPSLTKMYK